MPAWWEARHPAIVKPREKAWAAFVPFLNFDPEVRAVICTMDDVVRRSPRPCSLSGRHGALVGPLGLFDDRAAGAVVPRRTDVAAAAKEASLFFTPHGLLHMAARSPTRGAHASRSL